MKDECGKHGEFEAKHCPDCVGDMIVMYEKSGYHKGLREFYARAKQWSANPDYQHYIFRVNKSLEEKK